MLSRGLLGRQRSSYGAEPRELHSGRNREYAHAPSRSRRACQRSGGLPGIDVSSRQGSVDWTVQKTAGIKFAYILATGGTYATNSKFSDQYAGALGAGIVRGSYHFANPS